MAIAVLPEALGAVYLRLFIHTYRVKSMTSAPQTAQDQVMADKTNSIAEAIFNSAVQVIDSKFQQGYSAKNPALLSSVISLQEKIYVSLTAAK